MKNWSDLESGRVNLSNGHFTPSRGCDRKKIIKAASDNE